MSDQTTPAPPPPASPLASALDAPIGGAGQPEAPDLEELFHGSGSGTVVVRVHGNALADAHISDGDYLIIDCRNRTPKAGEIAMVELLDEKRSTLRRFYHEAEDYVRLESANEPPMHVAAEKCRIVGVMIGVLRSYSDAPQKPPPPATGTLARTLADELRAALAKAFVAVHDAEADAMTRGMADDEDVERRTQIALPSVLAAAKAYIARQPAPVAAGGAGQRWEQRWCLFDYDNGLNGDPVLVTVGNALGEAGGAGQGERRWGVMFNGQLRVDMWTTRKDAERSCDELECINDTARVVPVLVTVLEGEGGAEGAKRGPEVIPGNDRGDYQIGELCGTWLHAHVTGSDADFLRAKFRSLMHDSASLTSAELWPAATAARLAAAEAARAAAEAEVKRLHRIAVREPDETEAEVRSLGNRTTEACRAIDVWQRRASLAQKHRMVRELRAALEWYADERTYAEAVPAPGEHDGAVPIEQDNGTRARSALAPPAGGAAGRDGGA